MNTQAGEHIDGRADYCTAVEQLFSLATQQIALYSPRLPAYAYASPAAVEQLKQLLTSKPRAQARILVHEPRYAVSESNRLITLGMRLSSSVQFRDAPAHLDPLGDKLIIDGRHALIRPQADSGAATLWLDSPQIAREALAGFDKLWHASSDSTEIRNRTL